jgi:hypothetical protein
VSSTHGGRLRYTQYLNTEIAYGYDVSTDDDFFVTLIEDGANAMTKLIQPFFLIEIFPFREPSPRCTAF